MLKPSFVILDLIGSRKTFGGMSFRSPIDVVEETEMLLVLRKFSARTQLVLQTFQIILFIYWNLRHTEADLSTFPWLLNAPASFPDKELGLSFRIPLLSPTYLLFRVAK